MYTITFYSFKGGVGRTLALANVGMELVKRGRTVLLVDFDLEAPGLDAFPLAKPRPEAPGLVEFVTDYKRTGLSPDVAGYVYLSETRFGNAAKLWVMPSGIRGRGYSAKLQAIDWQHLYSELDGYLLLEDLKAQWQSRLKPDYVLVDSRTGHTDVCGICTRQLPDAVVLCFLPTEENIRGLETVVNEIRVEPTGSSLKAIDLFFVPSNIPRLDDEQHILARRLGDAKTRLGFEEPAGIIHRYESLSLLDNVIFTVERPDSSLATEYGRLTTSITRSNIEDRDVALRFLSGEDFRQARDSGAHGPLNSRLSEIRIRHASDGEVINALALFTRRLGRAEEAAALSAEAKRLGYRSAEVLLEAATQAHDKGHLEQALAAIREVLFLETTTYFDLNRALRMMLEIDVHSLEWLSAAPAVSALSPPERESLCQQMLVSRQALPVAEGVLRWYFERSPQADLLKRELKTPLMLCLIGQQKYREAMHVAWDSRPDPATLGMADAFNYAMAEWGASGRIPVDMFKRVADLSAADGSGSHGKNVLQCLAIAHWAVRDTEAAWKSFEHAEELAHIDQSESFSGWKYLQVSAAQFLEDLAHQKQMMQGIRILPAVFMD